MQHRAYLSIRPPKFTGVQGMCSFAHNEYARVSSRQPQPNLFMSELLIFALLPPRLIFVPSNFDFSDKSNLPTLPNDNAPRRTCDLLQRSRFPTFVRKPRARSIFNPKTSTRMSKTVTGWAKKSLFKRRPWYRKKERDAAPPGWEWDKGLSRWKDPPENWRFNGRYWFQIPDCKDYRAGKCQDGEKCKRFHPKQTPEEVVENSNSTTKDNSGVQTPNSDTSDLGLSPITSEDFHSILKKDFNILVEFDFDYFLLSASEEKPGPLTSDNSSSPTPKERPSTSASSDDDDNVPLPEYGPPQHPLKALQQLKGFEELSDKMKIIQQRLKIFEIQKMDLQQECSRMSLAVFGDKGLDYEESARLYHAYLRLAGVLKQDSKFVKLDKECSCSCSCSSCCGCWKVWDKFDAGFLFVAEPKGSRLRSKILSSLKEKPQLTIFITTSSKKAFDDLKEVLEVIPWVFELRKTDEKQLEVVIDEFLKSIERKFGALTKLEGGPDSAYVRVCAERILRDCTESDGKTINAAIKSMIATIQTRQVGRLQKLEPLTWETEDEQSQALLLTSEDLIGPGPDSSKFRIKEWDELQEMIRLETVKQSVQTMIDGLLLNHYRELQEQAPLKLSLSRLFLGPPGTGKNPISVRDEKLVY